MSILKRLRLQPHELAKLLVDLHSEGDTIPPSVFDELAEASSSSHSEAAQAVLGASDPASKVARGLELARLMIFGEHPAS